MLEAPGLPLRGQSGAGKPAASAHTQTLAAVNVPVTRDPVCGMSVDMAKTAHRTTHDGREIGFCSAGCKAKFEAAPEQYLTATDPVCGMKVKIAGAKNTTVHEGHTYYFCNPKCLQKFTAEPDRYLKPAEAAPAPPVAAGGRVRIMPGWMS